MNSVTHKRRTILFVGAGRETCPGIRLALAMGLQVVVSDSNAHAPGVGLANHFIHASTYDISTTVNKAIAFHREVQQISGVICLGTDVPQTVAAVAQALALPGITPLSAHLASDKLAMKQAFATSGVPTPWFAQVIDAAHLSRIVAEQRRPLVIKPADSRGARGVMRLMPRMDLANAWVIAHGHSPSGRVIVEHYLDGPQVSTESLIINGVAYTPGFSDRNYEFLERFAPHIIENGGELPSFLSREDQVAIKTTVQAGALAMGIRDGVVKGDIVLHRGQPHIIELAARLSGGYFCTHEIPLNTGVDLVGAAIRQCVGESIDLEDLEPRFQRSVAQRYLFPNPGVVHSIQLADWLRHDPEIALCEVRVKVGDIISMADAHPARAGLVIATGSDRGSAIRKAEAAVAAIRIKTRAT